MINKLINELIQYNCVKVGEFKLRNGETSKYYFDMKNLISHPLLLKKIGDILYNEFIKNKCDLICGIPIGSIPLCSYISTTYKTKVRVRFRFYSDDCICSWCSLSSFVRYYNGDISCVS